MSEKRDLRWFGGECPHADIIAHTLALDRKPCRGCFSPAGEDGLCEACRAEDEWDGVSPAVRSAAESTRTERDVRAERAARKPKIVTHYDPPPIPAREFDWSAVTDNYDGADIDENTASRDPIGYGRTEQEAIADLMEQIEERS